MTKDNPRITIITVTYNALEALKKTADSVLQQDYQPLEYIIVDGASTDGTRSFLQEQDTSIRWISEPDKGIYDAMNKGVGMASGEYCLFLNAGDTFVDEKVIAHVFQQMQNEKDADVIYGDVVKNGVTYSASRPRNCHRMFYCHQCLFTSTESLRQFPFDIHHRMSADFKQAKQLILAGKHFLHLPVPVANFDTTGVSNTQRSKGLWDNIKVVWEVDHWKGRCQFLPRLFFTYLLCRLRGK